MANTPLTLEGSSAATNLTLRNDDDGTLHILKNTTEIASLGAAAVKLGTGAIQVDSNKNIGFDVVPKNAWVGTIALETQGVNITSVNSTDVRYLQNAYYDATTASIYRTSAAASMYRQEAGTHYWYTAPSGTAGNAITWTTAMTLSASGKLTLVGDVLINNSTGINIYGSGGLSENPSYLRLFSAAGKGVEVRPNGANGAYMDAGATSWVAYSDERGKDIIEPITGAVERLSTWRTVVGKYKTDEEGTRRAFLIAQDVQANRPEAVATDSDGMLGVRYTETIPDLVAAIKELSTELNTVKARLAAIEGA